ncbi:MAG: hypothetical protein WC763_04265 [Candidatus Paceibacterota bacterium]
MKTFLCANLIFGLSFLPAISAFAAESSSTSYTITNSAVGSGRQMDSTSFSLQGTFSQSANVSYSSGMIPLAAGTITSCGKITSPGTYSLNSDLANISGPCFFIVSDNVTIDGGGHSITGVSGNIGYAVVATSSVASGGSSFIGIDIQDIVFANFTGGVNANGNAGIASGGNGGHVTVASSTLGAITANGGAASSGTGGDGGSISITSTDSLDFVANPISVTRGSGSVNGSTGTISVNGPILISGSEVWTGDDSSWTGSHPWTFTGNAYSSGIIGGDATFSAYTASSSVVTVDSNSDFHGTGRVNGTVFDSLGAPVTTWNLTNGSILTGTLSDNVIFDGQSINSGTVLADSVFNDSSYNSGTTTNAVFTASSFNSLGGIPNGDPTGISNGHVVLGTITFSATTSPVSFTINSGSTWGVNTSSWIFDTAGQNWIFNFSTNTGSIVGDASFNNSHNLGVVSGVSTFLTNSYNAGSTATSSFYGNSYNIGGVEYASFHDSSTNSHSPDSGTVSVRCDFFDSSLPGTGTCPPGATFYHIPYYFNGSVSTNWDDLGNWFFDATSTQPAATLPQSGDTVFIGASLTSGPGSAITLGSVVVASSTTGGGSFSVNLTNISAPAYFYASSTNVGAVNGTFHVFGDRPFSQVNTSGTFTGVVAFHDGSWNDVTIPGNVSFYDTSYNSSSGIVGGDAEFIGSNRNDGIVVGVATIYSGASVTGSGTVQGNTLNMGSIAGGIFSGIVTNVAGAITGAITNVAKMVFSGSGYVSTSGSLSGDADFNDNSSNRGIVAGTTTFSGSSYNTGTTSGATFIGDLSENVYNGLNGFVSGIKERLYTAVAPQLTFLRDFTDSAWTIIADNTLVKLVFGNLVNLNGQNPGAATTLVERNGGVILRPLAPGTINSCGVLDTEDGTYTLDSDIQNYPFDTCFLVRANGVTLDGGSHSVSGLSTSTAIYSVVSTSTLSVDLTSNAFTDLTIRNIRFSNFAHGLLGRGTDVPSGVGGNGTTVLVDHATIGNIDVGGGDPIERAGNGGNVSLVTSIAAVISSVGGNSTACGVAGNGGNISVTTDSTYESIIDDGGTVVGCPQEVSPIHGTHGNRNTSIVSPATKAAQTAALLKAPPTKANIFTRMQAFGLGNLYTVMLPIARLLPLNFVDLPVFGGTGAKSFSFKDSISRFLFKPLSESLDQTTSRVLSSLGIRYEKDFIALGNKPLTLSGVRDLSGLFTVSLSGNPVVSYITYGSETSIAQLVRVRPDANLLVGFVSDSKVTGSFNGKLVTFNRDRATITAPFKPGRYVLTTSASPIHLIVEVIKTEANTNISGGKTMRLGIFSKVVTWFFGLFR